MKASTICLLIIMAGIHLLSAQEITHKKINYLSFGINHQWFRQQDTKIGGFGLVVEKSLQIGKPVFTLSLDASRGKNRQFTPSTFESVQVGAHVDFYRTRQTGNWHSVFRIGVTRAKYNTTINDSRNRGFIYPGPGPEKPTEIIKSSYVSYGIPITYRLKHFAQGDAGVTIGASANIRTKNELIFEAFFLLDFGRTINK